MKTVNGSLLAFTTENGNIYVSDANGNKAMVTIADVNQSNGVIHVIDTVLLPQIANKLVFRGKCMLCFPLFLPKKMSRYYETFWLW